MTIAHTNGHAPDVAPSDADLQALRARVDEAEHALTNARANLREAMGHALEDGVTMTHLARVLGWSRQWCYTALSRW